MKKNHFGKKDKQEVKPSISVYNRSISAQSVSSQVTAQDLEIQSDCMSTKQDSQFTSHRRNGEAPPCFNSAGQTGWICSGKEYRLFIFSPHTAFMTQEDDLGTGLLKVQSTICLALLWPCDKMWVTSGSTLFSNALPWLCLFGQHTLLLCFFRNTANVAYFLPYDNSIWLSQFVGHILQVRWALGLSDIQYYVNWRLQKSDR